MSRELAPRPPRPLAELSETGLLWLINRVVFHPRGFALAIQLDDDGVATGWAMQGMGDEVWSFTGADDDDCFAKVEAFIASLRDSETTSVPCTGTASCARHRDARADHWVELVDGEEIVHPGLPMSEEEHERARTQSGDSGCPK